MHSIFTTALMFTSIKLLQILRQYNTIFCLCATNNYNVDFTTYINGINIISCKKEFLPKLLVNILFVFLFKMSNTTDLS